jgi:putative membrane protein
MIAFKSTARILAFTATVIAVSAAASAQVQGSPGGMQQPTSPSAQSAAGTSPTATDTTSNPQAADDRDFVRKALEGGEAEVQLGQLAAQKAQSDDVKQFAQKMVQDHSQIGDQVIKPLAKQMGVSEPKQLSKKDRSVMASLDKLSGAQFDQEYIKAMIKDHKQDLKDFKGEAEMSQDPNVKKAAQEGENLISQHLQMIQQIAQKHDVASNAGGR